MSMRVFACDESVSMVLITAITSQIYLRKQLLQLLCGLSHLFVPFIQLLPTPFPNYFTKFHRSVLIILFIVLLGVISVLAVGRSMHQIMGFWHSSDVN
jgi:hypothetical protein